MTDHTNILLGIGGSHAHGLATEESDIDYRGVFSWPTEKFFLLASPKESITTSDPEPDSTIHELKKFLTLAARGNPDVLELLGVDTFVDVEPEWGPRLLELKSSILAATGIRSAYMGYAEQQFQALRKRMDEGKNSFSAGMERRTWKHAKHMFRLMETGYRILSSGELDSRVVDREWYLETLPNLSLAEIVVLFEANAARFRDVTPKLRTSPDYPKIEQYLIDYRKAH
jgi:predicted nucleotidyltransferase